MFTCIYVHITRKQFFRFLKTFVDVSKYRTSGNYDNSWFLKYFIVYFREYEEKQLRSQQQQEQKKLEYENQISRLENQLDYERRRDTKGI